MIKLLVDDEDVNLFYKTFGYFDERTDEYNEGWTQVRNYDEFCNFINLNGIPDVVSFDSNLNDSDMDGYECAKFLEKRCIELGVEFPLWLCHSYMPSGDLRFILNEYSNRRVTDIDKQIFGES